MDIRYSANPKDVARYTTEELRKEFLITDLYEKDAVKATYSHVDRMVVLGILPVDEIVPIDKGIDVWANFGTDYFLERREAGVFNLGGRGKIVADGETFALGFEDCLYITKGTKEVTFESDEPADPARFYLVSAPAHTAYKSCPPASCPWASPSWTWGACGTPCPATPTSAAWRSIPTSTSRRTTSSCTLWARRRRPGPSSCRTSTP